jgi:hypothetical protein
MLAAASTAGAEEQLEATPASDAARTLSSPVLAPQPDTAEMIARRPAIATAERKRVALIGPDCTCERR